MSFSTAVAVAIERGGKVRPCLESDNASELARVSEGVAAVRRSEAGPNGQFSLSPLTFLDLEPDAVVVLPSLNGGSCCKAAREASALLVGCLVNAGAVAEAVRDMHRNTSRSVTVIACGEQDTTDGSRIRMAVEDYLGAGAILKQLPFTKSPEARVCQDTFTSSAHSLEELMLECESGQQLREAGFTEDVEFSARLDLYSSVPLLNGRLFSRL